MPASSPRHTILLRKRKRQPKAISVAQSPGLPAFRGHDENGCITRADVRAWVARRLFRAARLHPSRRPGSGSTTPRRVRPPRIRTSADPGAAGNSWAAVAGSASHNDPAAGALAELVLRQFTRPGSATGRQRSQGSSRRNFTPSRGRAKMPGQSPPSAIQRIMRPGGGFVIRARPVAAPAARPARRHVSSAVVSPDRLWRMAPDPNDEFDYFVGRARLLLAICRQDPCPGRF